MSCDLLENAKQGYQTSNGITLMPNPSDEVAFVPKSLENKSLDQLFLSYTNVSSLHFIAQVLHTEWNDTHMLFI